MLRLGVRLCVMEFGGQWNFSRDLEYEEFLVAIVDQLVHQLHTKEITMVKVLWSNHTVEDCTWETKAMMRDVYPYLFV